ncbi:MAG: hypothetical protein MUE97_06145 [Phycisphaerales bacterium]|jgi:hypothetical protein|nr:hypothetical protein [Phycisphaerales bacterium]
MHSHHASSLSVHRVTLAASAVLAFAAAAGAQVSNVDATNKFAWGENIGWLNWRDAGSPVASQGVVVRPGFLSGFIWAENVGWINAGDGTPAGPGNQYANANGTDFGVNRNPTTGDLSGFAWGENIGWINFGGGALATPAQPARFTAGRFTGYAWGENVGWINLSLTNAGQFVGATLACGPSDVAGANQSVGADGQLTADDIIVFLGWYFASDVRADVAGPNQSTIPDLQFTADDIIVFLSRYFAGC